MGETDDERLAWAVLASVQGIGPVSFGRLVGRLGSARAVLAAAAGGEARVLVEATADRDGGHALLESGAVEAIAAAAAASARLAADLDRTGVVAVTLRDDGYPPRLRAIDLPPPVLFVRGDPAALAPPKAVAVVGTRRPTEGGRAMAARIGESIAALGATVVSGLAYGVDGAAHAAAVRLRRPTVAVLGSGHGRLYPAPHRALADAIVEGGGAVVSEHAPGTQATRGTFPRRNRVISGLADATVVVEAGARSGALTTAAWALEQGRGLHIVPGRPGDPTVAGSLAFLREAGPEARIVAGIPELLEDLGLIGVGPAREPGRAAGDAIALAGLGTTEGTIAAALATGVETVDGLVAKTGLAAATVLGALTMLEVRGLVLDAFGRYRPTGALAAASRGKPAGALPGLHRALARRAARGP